MGQAPSLRHVSEHFPQDTGARPSLVRRPNVGITATGLDLHWFCTYDNVCTFARSGAVVQYATRVHKSERGLRVSDQTATASLSVNLRVQS